MGSQPIAFQRSSLRTGSRGRGRVEVADAVRDLVGLGLGLGEGQAFVQPGPGVAGFGEPCIAQEALALADELEQRRSGCASGELCGEGIGWGGGVDDAEVEEEWAGDEPVAEVAGVDAVVGEMIARVLEALVGEVPVHGAVDVDHNPAVIALSQEPGGVAVEDLVVVVRGRGTAVRGRIEGGRGEVDDGGAGGADLLAELADASLEACEAVFTEWEVDTVVHAVAGDDEGGFGEGEDAVEAFVEIGAREGAIGVVGFREAGHRFAGQAEVEEFAGPFPVVQVEEYLGVVHALSAVGDAVAEEE